MNASAMLRVKPGPVVAALLVLAVLVVGCGDDGQSPGNAEQLVREGWELFESGQYNAAVAKFRQAIGVDDTTEDAYEGLGWSYARLGSLEDAIAQFIYYHSNFASPPANVFAGSAIVQLALKNYDQAQEQASNAIDEGGEDYVFTHDPDVTIVTLKLVRAMANFAIGGELAYEAARDDVYDLGYQWLDETHPNFVANLMRAIHELRQLYGAGLLEP